MTEVVLTRIDDRFIHGQVVTKWLQYVSGCDEILICDDAMRQDAFLQMVMEMAAPPGVKVRVYSLDETIHAFEEMGIEDRRRMMILLRNPGGALRLIEGKVPIRELNVGGMGAGPGRKPLYKNISASSEELSTFEAIERKGIKVGFRVVPDADPGIDLVGLLKGRRWSLSRRIE